MFPGVNSVTVMNLMIGLATSEGMSIFEKWPKVLKKGQKNSKNNYPIWCVSWFELCDGNDWFCNQRRHVYIFLKNGQKFRKKAKKIAKIITRSGVFPGVNSVTVMIGFATSGGICFFPIPPP